MNRVSVLSQQVLPPTNSAGACTGLAAAVTAAKGGGKTNMHAALKANSNFIGEVDAENVDFIDMQGKFPAILIHGNSLDDCKCLDEWAKKALPQMPQMPQYTLGAADRDKLAGDTFTVNYADWDQPITPHTEMSYAIERPHVLAFSCVKSGDTGQTFLLNTVGVLEDVMQKPNLRRYFESGLMRVDRVLMKGYRWEMSFGSKEEGVNHMRKQGYKIIEDGDTLFVSFVMRHVERDAKGDRCSGFLSHFDPLLDCKGGGGYMERIMLEASKELNKDLHKEYPLDLEQYVQAWTRPPSEIEAGGMGLAGGYFTSTFLDTNGRDLQLQPEDAQELSEIARKHMEFIQWKPGDIVVIDNKRVMHGRLPRDPKVERDVRVALFGAYQVETLQEQLEGSQIPSHLQKLARGEQMAVA